MQIKFIIVNNYFMKQVLKYIYSVLIENLKFAESKHSILIALNSAIIVFVSGYLLKESIIVKFITCLIIIFSAFSLIFSFIALLSRKVRYKKKINFKEKELNLIYYKHIINFSYEQYLVEIKKYYNFPKEYFFDGLDYDLSKQIIATANVTNLKFIYFNFSLICLIYEIVLTVLDICLIGLGV